jgi:hypothetical protein
MHFWPLVLERLARAVEKMALLRAIPLGCSIPAIRPLNTVRSTSFVPRASAWPLWRRAAAVSSSSSAPAATSCPGATLARLSMSLRRPSCAVERRSSSRRRAARPYAEQPLTLSIP